MNLVSVIAARLMEPPLLHKMRISELRIVGLKGLLLPLEIVPANLPLPPPSEVSTSFPAHFTIPGINVFIDFTAVFVGHC